VFAGKIAREARSAGVTLALGTQKLSAKMLDTIPGAGDLKVNLSRVLLGKTSRGERMSALRDPDDTPDLNGIVPRGRGLWETTAHPALEASVDAPHGEEAMKEQRSSKSTPPGRLPVKPRGF